MPRRFCSSNYAGKGFLASLVFDWSHPDVTFTLKLGASFHVSQRAVQKLNLYEGSIGDPADRAADWRRG